MYVQFVVIVSFKENHGYASGFKILSAEAVVTTYPLLRKQILHAWQRKVLLFLSNKKIRVEHIEEWKKRKKCQK